MRRGVLVGVSITMVLSVPPALAAQDDVRSNLERELVARLDQLLPLLEEAEAAAAAVKAARDEAAKAASWPLVDTSSVGQFHVITPRSQTETALELLRDVWPEYSGKGTSPTLANHFITFQWTTDFVSIYVAEEAWPVEHPRWRSRSFVTGSFHGAIGGMLQKDLEGTRLAKEWVNAPIIAPNDLAGVYRELAAVPSQMSRACLSGDGLACWSAMGLDPHEGSIEEWYSPEEGTAWLQRDLGRYSSDWLERYGYGGCILGVNQGLCDSMLERRVEQRGLTALAPLTSDARVTMLWFALEQGGVGALERLREDPTMSPSEALQHASGLTPEALGDLWRDEVVAQKPLTYAGAIPFHWSTFFWIALFAAMAMRSTRWRLG